MFLPALPVVILWLALPLAAALLVRNSSLPTLTTALTLASGLLGAIVISLPAGMMTGTMAEVMGTGSGNLPLHLSDADLALSRQHYLIGLAMWLFGAGGLVLFAGGFAKGAKAGLLRAMGGFGLLLLYIAAGIQVAQSFLPLPVSADGTARQQPMHDIATSAEMTSAVGFLAGSVLILVLAVLTLLSRLGRG
ncbi:hypothetical protein ACSBLW_07510 [Thioclava sp. FR2]|uniref:hypothetical protein n=1 Tax=Thioclava sp. FR2 TaxID=3445780 RepID=UPI003EC02917